MKRSIAGVRAVALAAAGVIAVAGCGSTVGVVSQSSGSTQAGSLGLDGGLSQSTDLGTSAPAVAGNSGISSTDPTASETPTTGQPTDPSVNGSGPALPAGGTKGVGYDAKTITVGVIVSSSQNAFASALGVTGDTGNLGAQYDAVANYINAHGGVAHRKLVILKYDIDFATAVNNPSQAATQICTAFTQDHHVFAVLKPLPSAEQRDCLSKTKTPMIDAGSLFISQAEYDKQPSLLYGAGRVTTERVLRLLVTSLLARNFFEGLGPVQGCSRQDSGEAGFALCGEPRRDAGRPARKAVFGGSWPEDQ